jgi:hypothetical protein
MYQQGENQMRQSISKKSPMAGSGKTGEAVRKLSTEEIAHLVDKAIRAFEGTINGAGGKCSVGDLVRLLQLRKEMAGDTPGNVTVRWVNECEETQTER